MNSYPVIYRSDIDGLRAVAVLSVIAFHAWPNALPGGFVGVDIFFVISGFLISLILFKSLEEGRFSFSDFYSHRVRRIFPALLALLVVLLSVGWVILLSDEYRYLGKHSTAGALFVANFIFWREAGYFDVQSELKPLLHLWSLGIEEQYYLLWPVVAGFVWKRRSFLLLLTLGMVLLSFSIGAWLLRAHATAAFYLPFGRAWELLVGALLAWGQHTGGVDRLLHRRYTRASVVSLLGAILVLAAVALLDRSKSFPGWAAAIPVIGALCLISAGPSAWLNRKFLSARPLVAIGIISYPLYLWHWPLLSLARILDERALSPVVAAAAIVVAALLATVTYVTVEKPIRRIPASKCAPVLVVLMILVAGLGGGIAYSNGIPSRMQAYQDRVAHVKWARESEPVCLSALPMASRYCRMTDPLRKPTAVVVGDSHANRLFEGLSPRFAASGGNLMQLGEGGCLPFWGLEGGAAGESDTCSKRINGELDFVLAQQNLATVFLVARGPLYISGQGFGEVERQTRTFLRRVGHKVSSDYGGLYADAMTRTVSRLLAAGKRVVFVIDNPELGFNPLSCIKSRPMQITSDPRAPCAVPRATVDDRNARYRSIVSKVALQFPKLIVVDTQRILCDDSYCWAMKDGDLLYMDGDHLSRAGAQYVARYLEASLFSPR